MHRSLGNISGLSKKVGRIFPVSATFLHASFLTLLLAGSVLTVPVAAAETGGKTAGRGNDFVRDCQAAERGDAAATYRIARRYLFGNGVVKNHRVGAAWLRAAAARGHGEARKQVAFLPKRAGHLRPWCRPGTGPLRAGPPPPELVNRVKRIAPKYGIDPALVLAVIRVESAYRVDAVSPKAAAGLMQLIPGTADRFGVDDPFDPDQNITGGVRYLRWLLAYFQGDVDLALAGYNAGERAVDRHKGVPPYRETIAYVQTIRSLYPKERHQFDSGVVAPSPLVTAKAR